MYFIHCTLLIWHNVNHTGVPSEYALPVNNYGDLESLRAKAFSTLFFTKGSCILRKLITTFIG